MLKRNFIKTSLILLLPLSGYAISDLKIVKSTKKIESFFEDNCSVRISKSADIQLKDYLSFLNILNTRLKNECTKISKLNVGYGHLEIMHSELTKAVNDYGVEFPDGSRSIFANTANANELVEILLSSLINYEEVASVVKNQKILKARNITVKRNGNDSSIVTYPNFRKLLDKMVNANISYSSPLIIDTSNSNWVKQYEDSDLIVDGDGNGNLEISDKVSMQDLKEALAE